MRAKQARSSGQVTVEFVALLPVLLLVLVVLWQALVAGQAIWLSGAAARSAARAQAIGVNPTQAAREVVPKLLRKRLRVKVNQEGVVTVRIGIPTVIGGRWLGTIQTASKLQSQQ